MNHTRLIAVLFFMSSCALAIAADDGLIFEKDKPVSLPAGAVAQQISYGGLVDGTNYKEGLILDKNVRIRVWEIDNKGAKGANPLYDKTEEEVVGLRRWTGTTKRVGGFPQGLYYIQVEVKEFKPDGKTDARPAILVKEAFQIK